MGSLVPLAVGEKNAAQLLDLKLKEFRSLVEQGILPRPRKVGPFDRWDAAELQAVIRGDFVDGFESVKW
jgi:predicted DNA-binding transcriptional regulator AlpA